jgi:hypothetical protein
MPDSECQTLRLAEAAKMLGPSYATLRRLGRETGYIDAGRTVKLLDFGPQSLYVSRAAVERLLAGDQDLYAEPRSATGLDVPPTA